MKVLFVDVDNICYEGIKSGSLCNSMGMLKEIGAYNHVEILEIYNPTDSNTDRNNQTKTFYEQIDGIKVTNSVYDLQNIDSVLSAGGFDCVITTLFSVFLERRDIELLALLRRYSRRLVININDVLYVKYDALSQADAELYRDILKSSTVIACSEFVKRNVSADLGVESLVVYPLTNISAETVEKEDGLITFINPIELKGLKVFERVAAIMPERQFLVVCGWQESEGYRPLTENVKVIPFQKNVLNVWKQTGILLALSIVPEAYCRVVTEALLNNCEVIGFDVGGVKEAACGAGCIIEPIRNYGSAIYPQLREEDIDRKAEEIRDIIEGIRGERSTRAQVLEFLRRQGEERAAVYGRIFNE